MTLSVCLTLTLDGRLVCRNFLKGLEVTLPYSYRSNYLFVQGKVTPSPGKSLSQGKLRVINQGLQQSENIQTPR